MLRVVVLGDHVGFRTGTPAGNYVGLVARALAEGGASVVRLPPEGGPPSGRLHHLLAVRRSVAGDRPDIVLYYGHSLPTMAWCRLVTWRSATRFVLHAVEWPPASRGPGWRAWLRAQAYARSAFRLTDGVVVISAELERKVAAVGRRRSIPAFRLPILVDAEVELPPAGDGPGGGYGLYCGDLGGYLDDVRFLVRAFAAAEGDLRLVLVGRGSDEVVRTLRSDADATGLGARLEVVTEVLPYDELLATYAGAEVLLAPLPDDERSRARYPSKLADYLLSGRPVVASRVGEVADLLSDGVDGYLAPPGSEAAFAAAITRATSDPERDQVGRAGRATAQRELDLHRHGDRLVAFLQQVAVRDPGRSGAGP